MATPIQPLPSDVVNLIAAGEVIDSLAAGVRELVENSIDAGTTRINVSVYPDLWTLRVVDNGVGMALANLQQAAAAHSTNKIQNRQDLLHINSLGFRGEALHSLAQLGTLSICSRSLNTDEGWQLTYDHQGEATDTTTVAIAPGTVITIKDLFGTWPARRNVLPHRTQQLRQIQLTLYHLALCHPHITWQIDQNDRDWFSIYPGDTALAILPQLIRTVQPSDLCEADYPGFNRDSESTLNHNVSKSPDDALRFANTSYDIGHDIVSSSNQEAAVYTPARGTAKTRLNPPKSLLERGTSNPSFDQKQLCSSDSPTDQGGPGEIFQDVEFKQEVSIQGRFQEGRPTPSPSQEGEPTPSPSQEGRPTPSPSQEGRPTPSPSQEGEPTPSPSQEGERNILTPQLPNSLTPPPKSKIYLVLGLPDRCHRYRSDWIKIAINGRVVRSPQLEQTIMGAFRRILPRDRYPICFVHLHVPPNTVDWNRHPAKLDIYLDQMAGWRKHVADAIAQTLSQHLSTTDSFYSERVTQLIKTAESAASYNLSPEETQHPTPQRPNAPTPQRPDSPTKIQNPPEVNLLNLNAIAQVHSMYILAEHPSGMWLIEQHIAHERVLYEQLCDVWQVDSLDTPIILSHLSATQVEQLQRLNIAVDTFGDHLWAIRTLPKALIGREDCSDALLELSQGGNIESAIVATACRTAIRNGTPMSQPEMQQLLDDWQRTRHPHTCPHGRPIYLVLEETHLSRFFRRHWVIGKSHGI